MKITKTSSMPSARSFINVFRVAGILGVGMLTITACSGAVSQSQAVVDSSAAMSEKIEFLNSGVVTPQTLPFSEGVRVGNLVFLSGQVGLKPGTLELVPGGMVAEARQTLDNIRASLTAHGMSMTNVVKCTVMLADMSEWGAFNEIYKEYFSEPFPARSAIGANGLALGARVEVECIAAVGNRSPV